MTSKGQTTGPLLSNYPNGPELWKLNESALLALRRAPYVRVRDEVDDYALAWISAVWGLYDLSKLGRASFC